jgi:putative endonuclease
MARQIKSPPRPDKVAAFWVSISAESRTAAYLVAKGYRILVRRWKSPLGEIDIVARRRKTLIFVEVKAYASLDDASFGTVKMVPTLKNRRLYRQVSG